MSDDPRETNRKARLEYEVEVIKRDMERLIEDEAWPELAEILRWYRDRLADKREAA